MKEKIAFPQLVGLVAQKASTTERMSELFLQELFAVVTQELAEGKSVTIKGVGTFKPTKDDSGKDVAFTADKDLAEAVNAPFAQFSPVELCDEVTDEMLHEIDAAMEQPQEESQENVSPKEDATQAQEEQAQEEQSEQAQEEQSQESIALEQPQPLAKEEETPTSQETTIAPITSAPSQDEEPQDSESRNYRKWIIAATAAVALIAAWYIFTHRSKDHRDKDIETTPIARNDSTARDAKPQPVVTDTMSGNNVIFTMAKKHYGDQAFWVYIALENKAQYPDYRNIPAGAILVIPPASKYGINSDSKHSIKQAGIEAMKLYKEVKALDDSKLQEDSTATKAQSQKDTNSKSYKSTHKQHHRNYSSRKSYRRHYRRR